MSKRRADRVGELIKEEVAKIVLSGEIKHSRIGIVTFTGYDISSDLSSMSLFVSVLGNQDSKKETSTRISSFVHYQAAAHELRDGWFFYKKFIFYVSFFF